MCAVLVRPNSRDFANGCACERLQRAENECAYTEGDHATEQQAEGEREKFTAPLLPSRNGPSRRANCADMTNCEPQAKARTCGEQVDGCPRHGRHAEHRQGW